MGINYYFRKQVGEKCTHCGRSEEYESLHVGKSCYGWKFCFDTNHHRYNSFKVWKEVLETAPDKLYDEYGKKVSLYEFYKKVDSEQDGAIGEDDFTDSEGYRFAKYSDFH